MAADFTEEAQIRQVGVRGQRHAFGPVDIAVFNVYGPNDGFFDDTTDEGFAKAYNNMVMALVWMTRAVIPDMKAKGWGRLVTVGSICARSPTATFPWSSTRTSPASARLP